MTALPGVILEHPHLDSVGEHGGDHGKEVLDALMG